MHFLGSGGGPSPSAMEILDGMGVVRQWLGLRGLATHSHSQRRPQLPPPTSARGRAAHAEVTDCQGFRHSLRAGSPRESSKRWAKINVLTFCGN